MNLHPSLFPARLAWRQLIHDRAKLIAATLGVLFACVLVFMQLGFRDSLMTSAASAPMRLKGDLFLMHRQTEALWRPQEFNRAILMRALAHPDVREAHPIYISLGAFKNIDTRVKRTLMVYAFDPDINLMRSDALMAQRAKLKLQDTVLFDIASRPEFGDVARQIAAGRDMTEINDRRVRVAGTFLLGTSFAADGNVITSDLNFHRIFPGRSLDQIDLGVIFLVESADTAKLKRELSKLLDEEVHVFTYQDLIDYERDYWNNNAPIGFIFGFGVVMGLIVGMVIVYQILFTDITNNLQEYATLKAMGYSQSYLVRVVFASAALLAVFGFVPGFLLSLGLYSIAESNIYIPFPMPLSKVTMVFAFILIMCAGAGVLAIRKLKAANPADMF